MGAALVKVEHVNPFILATKETFSTMVNMEVKPGKIQLKQGSGLSFDVSGIIGLSGDAKGTVSLSFTKDSAIQVASSFVGEKLTSLDDSVVDAIGELANIIAGAAKQHLHGFSVNISLPSVILGSQHELKDPKDVMAMVLPFDSPAGIFHLAVALKSAD